MRASKGINFHYHSGVGTTSAEGVVEGRLRHIVSFSLIRSELLKLSAHHLNNKRIHMARVYEESVVDLVISTHVQD